MITLFNYLLIFNIFAGGFVLYHSSFEFYLGYIFIVFFLVAHIVHYKNFAFNFSFSIILAILFFSSFVNIYLGNVTTFLVMKQVLGILITGSAYFLLIRMNGYNVDKLFKIYLRIALIVAIIGIIQEFSFLIGFKLGYDYSWIIPKWKCLPAKGGMLRVNSIFLEPSHLVISMAPALFISLVTIFKNNTYYLTKKASTAIIICFVLTFSVLFYIAILISMLIIYSKEKKSRYLLMVLIMAIFFYIGYSCLPEIRMRVDDTVGVVTGALPPTHSHLTVYAYISNASVAFKSFMKNPLFGSGLGSHLISYDRSICPSCSNVFLQDGYTGINKTDANSLFLRLISETGLFGIIVVFYFIFRFRLNYGTNKNMQILSNAVFVLFIIQLLRQGHYFYNGLFFFVWIYYFVFKIYNKPE